MSIATNPKFKREVGAHPCSPNDDVYLLLGPYTCPHCNNRGRKRHFAHLKSLILHIGKEHVHRGSLANGT